MYDIYVNCLYMHTQKYHVKRSHDFIYICVWACECMCARECSTIYCIKIVLICIINTFKIIKRNINNIASFRQTNDLKVEITHVVDSYLCDILVVFMNLPNVES